MPTKTHPLLAVVFIACSSNPVGGTSMSTSSETGLSDEITTSDSETGASMADTSTDGSESETGQAEPNCGNGVVEMGEQCDDGNPDDHDACTSVCLFPTCDDGAINGGESDVDCGGGCSPCLEGMTCKQGVDCTTLACIDGECRHPVSCRQLKDFNPSLATGLYTIDTDGPGPIEPFRVLCEMERDNGGWTLTMVASDDGIDTWTWDNRTLLGVNQMLVGSISDLSTDFKSLAHHTVAFADLLFVHRPSDVWAAYHDVGDGTLDFGTFMAIREYPVCDYGLPGNGFEMSAGTLLAQNKLCDTMLYFHVGDHDNMLENCLASLGDGTYGPTWNGCNNYQCPFDDPVTASFGPWQPNNVSAVENAGVGFGHAAGLNTGETGVGENYMHVYVR